MSVSNDASCFVCGVSLDMTQDEIGYDDADEPLGLPCENCGRKMDDEAREAEHLADLNDLIYTR